MIRTTLLIGLLAVIFYCAVAAPARAQDAGAYASAAGWRVQRRLLPGLIARNTVVHELPVAARVPLAKPSVT